MSKVAWYLKRRHLPLNSLWKTLKIKNTKKSAKSIDIKKPKGYNENIK